MSWTVAKKKKKDKMCNIKLYERKKKLNIYTDLIVLYAFYIVKVNVFSWEGNALFIEV